MKIIQQDMLALKEGILFHQVNCQGVMGGGIAASLARKFPGLELSYQEFSQKTAGDAEWRLNSAKLLGKVHLFQVNPKLYIANVFGQDNVSHSSRQTSYDATADAFERVKKSMDRTPNFAFARYADQFYFPFKMGCGLGGGDWQIYSAIIEHYFPDAIICQHNV